MICSLDTSPETSSLQTCTKQENLLANPLRPLPSIVIGMAWVSTPQKIPDAPGYCPASWSPGMQSTNSNTNTINDVKAYSCLSSFNLLKLTDSLQLMTHSRHSWSRSWLSWSLPPPLPNAKHTGKCHRQHRQKQMPQNLEGSLEGTGWQHGIVCSHCSSALLQRIKNSRMCIY